MSDDDRSSNFCFIIVESIVVGPFLINFYRNCFGTRYVMGDRSIDGCMFVVFTEIFRQVESTVSTYSLV